MADVPEFLPLYADITAESEKRITLFLTRMKAEMNPVPKFMQRAAESGTSNLPTTENEERLMAYAFLRARHWNVDGALRMAQHCAAYRQRLNLDDSPMLPSPLSIRGYDETDVIRRCKLTARPANDPMFALLQRFNSLLLSGYHYWDKRGLPVAYSLLGRIDVRDALKKGKQMIPVGYKLTDYIDSYMTTLVETGGCLTRYQDIMMKENPIPGVDTSVKRRFCVTVVVDAKGMTYRHLHKPAVDLLKEALQHVNGVYADCVHRILVVNCPSMIRFAFDIVKPAMDEGLQEKFVFVSPENTPLALDRVIGKEHVPSFLGGTCNCPGGCMAGINANAVFSAEEGDSEDVMTENIKLSAGSKHQKVFEMVQGEDVIWEFLSTKGVDVRFSVYFYPKQAGVSVDQKKSRVKIDKKVKKTTTEDPLVKAEKLKDGADHFMAPEDGILQLVWDNSKSWVQDKPVQMRVYKSAPILVTPDGE